MQEGKQILISFSLTMNTKNYQTGTGYEISFTLSWDTNLRNLSNWSWQKEKIEFWNRRWRNSKPYPSLSTYSKTRNQYSPRWKNPLFGKNLNRKKIRRLWKDHQRAASWCTGGGCFKFPSKEFGEWTIKIKRYWTGKQGTQGKTC